MTVRAVTEVVRGNAAPDGLADSQLALILDAARRVPKLWRDRWLGDATDFLTAREIDDAAVRAAIDHADARVSFALARLSP